ncbi:MAG: BolA family protein [Mariprofundaceae bacterium]|nr:BolA family protein [Mariprofundaceae bacterium]
MSQPSVEEIRLRILEKIPDASVDVCCYAGDDHFEAVVVSAFFEKKPKVRAHQAVYAALGSWMHQEIHALALTTMTPQQWKERENTNV